MCIQFLSAFVRPHFFMSVEEQRAAATTPVEEEEVEEEEIPEWEVKDKYGRTHLFIAAQAGRLDLVKYLVEECDANRETTNILGNTPLHIPAFNGHIDVVKYYIYIVFYSY